MSRPPVLTAMAVLCLIDFPPCRDRPADPLMLPLSDEVDRVVAFKKG